ncbi:MAG: hypothetical protein J5494_00670, partial [Candidatus Methanomethylophilaceae archaeon]|nr:hypothetical protein [Candidatus Methanomethylophilaceae archaeon]
EETGKETGFRDAISEAQSALCDRDRPALSIPEYGKKTDQDIIQLMLRLTREKERLSSECTDRRLADVSVIAGTPLQFVSRFRPRGSADDGRMELDADRIFLDEAGYCSLMHAILLFSNGVPVTFLGDHMQLPPGCEIGRDMILSWMERNTAMKNVFLWDMNALYCEELLTKNPDSIIYSYRSGREAYLGLTKLSELTETRRFGPDLAEILDNFVYRNGMKGNAGSGLRIICINAVCGERRDRENEAEKDSVLEYLESEDPEPSETAVLTPYSSQAKLLKHNLGKYSDCVMTVHSSQGREWDTVIISVADHGSGEKEVPLRFTSSETPIGLRVINTAVSRVRKNLVIVCDRNYWIHKDGELVCEIIKKAELRVPEREKYNGNR